MKTNFAFDKIKSATRSAFDRVARVADVPNNPDMVIYDRLKPTDFSDIIRQYGVENAMKYIREMEYERLRGQNGQG